MFDDRWFNRFFREVEGFGVKPMQEVSPGAARAQVGDVARLNGVSPVMHRVTSVTEAVLQARGQGALRQVRNRDVIMVSGNGGNLDYHATLVLSPHRGPDPGRSA